MAGVGGGPQGGRGVGAGAEVADGESLGVGFLAQPGGGVQQPGQQPDVEDIVPVGFFRVGEQVEQQGAEPGAVQSFGDEPVARAVPTAAAAVGEDHDSDGAVGHGEPYGAAVTVTSRVVLDAARSSPADAGTTRPN
ncbi:hypothetical protein ACFQ3Z_45895 [Streptomyces nogalater]